VHCNGLPPEEETGVQIELHDLDDENWDDNSIAPNFAKSAKWFKRAADEGHPESQYKMGRLFFAGKGVGQNCTEGCPVL
jgi:TPR repeat protein